MRLAPLVQGMVGRAVGAELLRQMPWLEVPGFVSQVALVAATLPDTELGVAALAAVCAHRSLARLWDSETANRLLFSGSVYTLLPLWAAQSPRLHPMMRTTLDGLTPQTAAATSALLAGLAWLRVETRPAALAMLWRNALCLCVLGGCVQAWGRRPTRETQLAFALSGYLLTGVAHTAQHTGATVYFLAHAFFAR